MKFNKIFTGLFGIAVLALAASCNEETKYEPAAPSALQPYYFTTLTDTKQYLVDGQTNFPVYMGRTDATEELTVPITAISSAPGAFTAPETVTFPAGENTLTFYVEFDLANIEVNTDYTLELKLDGIENSPYAYGDIKFDIFYLPWRSFESKGIYRDGSISALYGIDPDGIQYDVEVQEHPTIDGLYRLVNPYGPDAFPYAAQFDYDDSQNHYMIIHAENPKKVYIEPFATGIIDGSDGMLYIDSYSNIALENNSEDVVASVGLFATLEEGVIRYREDLGYLKQSLVCYFDSNPNTIYYGNTYGMFKVVLPGYEDEPEISEWQELGMFNFTDGFASPIRKVDNNTYPVLVEQYIENPSIYRIVNPYGPESGLTDKVPAEPTYMVIDATHPDCVLVEPYETSFNNPMRGALVVTTMANWTMLTEELELSDILDLGLGGQMKDNKITFPAENCGGYYKRAIKTWLTGANPYDAVLDLSTPVVVPESTLKNLPPVKEARK